MMEITADPAIVAQQLQDASRLTAGPAYVFSIGTAKEIGNLLKRQIDMSERNDRPQRCEFLIDALLVPLVHLRDRYAVNLDPHSFSAFFALAEVEALAWGTREYGADPEFVGKLEGVRLYLKSLPGYAQIFQGEQSAFVQEQHLMVVMHMSSIFYAFDSQPGV